MVAAINRSGGTPLCKLQGKVRALQPWHTAVAYGGVGRMPTGLLRATSFYTSVVRSGNVVFCVSRM